jgi:hypothetical protein
MSLASTVATAPSTPAARPLADYLGERSISEFVIQGDVGRGAYGLVKRGREVMSDGSYGVSPLFFFFFFFLFFGSMRSVRIYRLYRFSSIGLSMEIHLRHAGVALRQRGRPPALLPAETLSTQVTLFLACRARISYHTTTCDFLQRNHKSGPSPGPKFPALYHNIADQHLARSDHQAGHQIPHPRRLLEEAPHPRHHPHRNLRHARPLLGLVRPP